MKTCSKCTTAKGDEDFPKKGCMCKVCVKEYMREYHQKNKEVLAEKQKENRNSDPEERRARERAYYANTRERRLQSKKTSAVKNKDAVAARMKDYYAKHTEVIKTQVRKRQENLTPEQKAHQRVKANERARLRTEIDANYKVKKYIACRIRTAIKKGCGSKNNSTAELVGCDIQSLREHLENQFQQGMSWANYGDWHVDHRLPCAMFDLTQECEQKRCFHFSNLQPMWGHDNIVKSAQVSEEDSLLTSLYLLFESR